MFLLIDNYDSFTYNIVHYLADLGVALEVRRNDKITVAEIEKLAPKAIFISPGPATPDQSGICLELIAKFYQKIPILGVCLGHQAIAQVFGANIIRAPEPVHGKISAIKHDGKGLFNNLPNPLNVVRYHSLIIEEKSLSDEFIITSRNSNDDIIMSIKHKKYPLEGVQFHPESIATDQGKDIFANFIKIYCELNI